MPALLALVAAALVAAVLAGCGGEDASTAENPAPPPSEFEAGLEHIHGLGVTGDTLYIATHTGLWVAPDGQTQAQRVSESRQDIMGFSVVAEDRFIGSGHPGPNQEMPPNLGLIESRDGGRTWESVSLMGEADFHVLESARHRIYGFDGTQGRLMVSADAGRSWKERRPPAGVFSVAVDPQDDERTIASTEVGIFVSSDAGGSWRPVNQRLAGLLAWPAPDRLYLVDGAGQAQASADAGKTWEAAGSIGGQPAAFIAHDDDLYAALADGTVRRSSDGGASWSVRATP